MKIFETFKEKYLYEKMRPYGVRKGDLGCDCTDSGKYGSSKLKDKCSCGKEHGKKSSDHKSRKAKERNLQIDLNERYVPKEDVDKHRDTVMSILFKNKADIEKFKKEYLEGLRKFISTLKNDEKSNWNGDIFSKIETIKYYYGENEELLNKYKGSHFYLDLIDYHTANATKAKGHTFYSKVINANITFDTLRVQALAKETGDGETAKLHDNAIWIDLLSEQIYFKDDLEQKYGISEDIFEYIIADIIEETYFDEQNLKGRKLKGRITDMLLSELDELLYDWYVKYRSDYEDNPFADYFYKSEYNEILDIDEQYKYGE